MVQTTEDHRNTEPQTAASDAIQRTTDNGRRTTTIAVVIINYRTPGLTLDCLASLAAERAGVPALSAVVVDNASGDGSDDEIERAIAARGWGDWARLVRSPTNGGFSAGNNVGIRSIQADVYWLLNSDTVVRPGATAELVRALEARPDAGLISPALERTDGSLHQSCFRTIKPPTELVHAAGTGPITRLFNRYEPALPTANEPFEPEWTCFASVMIRSWVFERIGLLDEGYFMYFEDADFCRRARDAGIPLVHWPAARVMHIHGQSGSVVTAGKERKRRPRYYYQARARYYKKFHGALGLLSANLYWNAGRFVSWARELAGNKKPHACEREGLDIWIR